MIDMGESNTKKVLNISSKGIDLNFLGFSAGISLLHDSQKDPANGGVEAKVSTPWGSCASAGMKANAGESGLGGGLWARSALTPDIAAKAGLGGNITKENINGGLLAAAKTPLTGEHTANLEGNMDWKKQTSSQ